MPMTHFHIQIPYSGSLIYKSFNISTPKTLATTLLPKLLKTSHTYNNLLYYFLNEILLCQFMQN